MVGAAKAAQAVVQRHGQSIGYAATLALQFLSGEVDPETGAAGTAAGASVVFSHRLEFRLPERALAGLRPMARQPAPQ